jgi:hypothetical protein
LYKGKRFEKRTVAAIKRDIDTVKRIADGISALSWQQGEGGRITKEVLEYVFNQPQLYNDQVRSIALWLYMGGKNVFFQDANSITVPNAELVELLTYLKKVFPNVSRVTSYARSSTIAKRKSVAELRELRGAGLTRLHVGLESGSDVVLRYVHKGVTGDQHIAAGRKVIASGIELSEYVIIGLGGRNWWREHALESARVLSTINPDFIRLRSLKLLPHMLLHKEVEKGEFMVPTDEEMVTEERLFIENLVGISSTVLSDHILNLLMEVEGTLPEEKKKMLNIIDTFLNLPPEDRTHFRLGKRAGIYNSVEDMSDPVLRRRVEILGERIEQEFEGGVEAAISKIKEAYS